MNYRTVTLHAEEDLAISGTKTIDVNVKDPITALIFQTRITYLTGARLIPEPDVYPKIELVSGSDVLMSLSGTEMAALSFYEGGKEINWTAENLLSTTDEGYLRVNFGRYLRDPLLALDPNKFRNLQLKITYNAALVQAAATHVYLRVVAECFDEKVISPVGFLQNREFHSYTGAATTHEYIDLPTDLPIRKLFLQTKYFGGAMYLLLTSMRLSEDNDKRVPFDILCRDLLDMELAEFGRCMQHICAQFKGDSYPVWSAICNIENVLGANVSAAHAFQVHLLTGGKITLTADNSSEWFIGSAKGSLPYYVHCYPFGNQMEIDDWYDVTRVGALRFDVYSGSQGASATYNTILQQLRRY